MRRRTFLHDAGVGAAALLVPVGTRAQARSGRSITSTGSALAETGPRDLVSVSPGTSLGHGWRLAEIAPVADGLIPVTLVHHDGAVARVMAFRRSPLSSGVAQTRYLDLRIMNGGDGGEPTHEGLGLAVLALAARIRAAEPASLGRAHRAALRALHSHERRLLEVGGRPV